MRVEDLLEYIAYVVDVIDVHHHMSGCLLDNKLHCDPSFCTFFVVGMLLDIDESCFTSSVLHFFYLLFLINRPVYFEFLIVLNRHF